MSAALTNTLTQTQMYEITCLKHLNMSKYWIVKNLPALFRFTVLSPVTRFAMQISQFALCVLNMALEMISFMLVYNNMLLVVKNIYIYDSRSLIDDIY